MNKVPRMSLKRLDAFIPPLIFASLSAVVTFLWTANTFGRQIALATYANEQVIELQPLLEKYGTTKASTNHEEWLIRDFFQDRLNGVFLDVGAHHYQHGSNTFYLETVLGWSGIAIEPQREFEAEYAQFRPRTRFIPLFVSDIDGASIKFYLPTRNKAAASSDSGFAEGFGGKIASSMDVETATLNTILEQSDIKRLDFVSIDIELAEPKALAGFDIRRYGPSLVCIESQPEVRQNILDYFHRHDYVVVAKYLRIDSDNLYFQPIESR